MAKSNVLIFDIETAPNLAYVWGKYEQNVIDYLEEWSMLCFCWKWLGQKKISSASMYEYKTEKELMQVLWDLFDKADVIIAHNGDAFDIKKTNAKFLEHGMAPPSPYKTIDTKKVAKKYFKLNSNSLNDISVTLGLGEKVDTGGFELWLGCMRNEKRSWDLMIKYCRQDIVLLEKVYLKFLPWIANHPNYNVFNNTSHNCPKCGSDHLQSRGWSITAVSKRKRYQCQDCGGWSLGEIERTEAVVR